MRLEIEYSYHGYVAYTCRMDGPVARAAKMVPEAAQVLREEPVADSVSPADAPADGAVSLAQFQAGNSDSTSARLGARKLGLHPVSPVLLSQHGKYFTVSTIPRQCLVLATSSPPVIISKISRETERQRDRETERERERERERRSHLFF